MSIYNKIRIIFLVSFLFVTAFFTASFYIKKSEDLQKIEKRYMQTSLFLHRHFKQSMMQQREGDFSDTTVKLYLKETGFRLILDDKKKEYIQKRSKVLHKRRIFRSQLKILRLKHKRYLSLKSRHFQLLLLDKEDKRVPWALFLGYLITLFFLMGLYTWLIRSLNSLKTLQEKIHKVAQGDLSIAFKSDNNDEIAQVSNAFDNALRKLESYIDSRQLFLRTIMHELKTPIGKGKILNAFLEDIRLKEGYEDVFERLEILLGEFAKIEQMLSSNYQLNLRKYNAKDLIDQALEIMIMDEEALKQKVRVTEASPLVLTTDFTLFPLALKNLIDNAIKYAPDHTVEVVISKEGISILNSGLQFTEDIANYFTPFHGNGEGLGLGLYIVHNIMEMLNLDFSYKYEKHQNIFSIRSV